MGRFTDILTYYAARIAWRTGSTKLSRVRLSVCPIDLHQQLQPAGLLLVRAGFS